MLILCGHFSSMHILLATSSGTPCRLLNDYACVHMFIRYICIYLITGTVKLPEGEYQYKFIVDEEWVHDPQEESVYNNFGSRNNVLKITSKDFEASGLSFSPPRRIHSKSTIHAQFVLLYCMPKGPVGTSTSKTLNPLSCACLKTSVYTPVSKF